MDVETVAFLAEKHGVGADWSALQARGRGKADDLREVQQIDWDDMVESAEDQYGAVTAVLALESVRGGGSGREPLFTGVLDYGLPGMAGEVVQELNRGLLALRKVGFRDRVTGRWMGADQAVTQRGLMDQVCVLVGARGVEGVCLVCAEVDGLGRMVRARWVFSDGSQLVADVERGIL